jgi:hypothetical protein
MPDDSNDPTASPDAYQAAERLAAAFEAEGCDYAIGGALALGYWATPRGTIDVDVTLYVSPKHPTQCIRLLQRIGCDFDASRAQSTIAEHGFCQVTFHGCRVDVFLPLIDFYDEAKPRRRQLPLGQSTVYIWEAEALCVFKMMFFREKDLLDVKSLLRAQAGKLDVAWIETTLISMYGQRDPRIRQWRELAAESRRQP